MTPATDPRGAPVVPVRVQPMVFSAPMVRALLREAREPGMGKTQTRRLIRDEVRDPPGIDAVHPKNTIRHPAPYLDSYCGAPRMAANPRGMSDHWCWWTRDDRQCLPTFKVPFVPGDRRWVQEAVRRSTGEWFYEADGAPVGWPGRAVLAGRKYDAYQALFLPQTASRLTLTVTEVRVQRLAEISEADAEAEGLACLTKDNGRTWKYGIADRDGWPGTDDDGWPWTDWNVDPRRAYATLWDRLRGRGAYEASPWVAALTFSVALANVDAPVPTPQASLRADRGLDRAGEGR